MAKQRISIRLDTRPLRAYGRLVRRATPGTPFDDMFRQWGVRYLAFTRRRFNRLSRSGGGGWPPLAASTIRSRRGPTRRKARKGSATKTTARGSAKNVSILRDTGTLFNALTIGMPGNLYRRFSGGIDVGFGGPSRHKKGNATIRDIAEFHQKGAGNLPRREILVQPDGATVRGMLSDMRRAAKALGIKLEK